MSSVFDANRAMLMGRERYGPTASVAVSRSAYFSDAFERLQWERCFDKLQEIGGYESDWNDERAEPLSSDVVSVAFVVVKTLRANLQPPPTQCLATDEGHVIFIWHEEAGYSELEIDRQLVCTYRTLRPGARRAESIEFNRFSAVV